jgi:diaminopimelate decarboxylase
VDHFQYRDGILHAEDVPLERIADAHGTPCYVYSRATLERHWCAFDEALAGVDHAVCYAVKANSNLAVLDVLARLGSWFDIVSAGELARVVAAGGSPARVVFSGVGKGVEEMREALEQGVHVFNVESDAELSALEETAGGLGRIARVSLRVNPDVDAGTHPYIATGLQENKFGIPIAEAVGLYQRAAASPHLEVTGVDCHIGSQLTSLRPYLDAIDRVLALVDELASRGIRLHHLDFGGGLGIRYRDEEPPSPADYARAVRERLAGRRMKLLVEPGRAIAGNAGVLLTRVRYLKRNEGKRFAVVDAAMNDLLRPALYGAWQDIVPVDGRPGDAAGVERVEAIYDVVGAVCESADFLGKERALRLHAGDLLAVRSAGAYGFVMSSNYNTRPRAPEVLVDGDRVHLARRRETVQSLFADETPLPRDL